MRIVVWNSQGAKWDWFWTNYIFPSIVANTDVVGLLVESGWAPWVASGDVKLNALYPCTENVEYFNPRSINPNYAAFSVFAQQVATTRVRYGFWIPWQKNLDGGTNTRVSMGGILLPKVAGTYVDMFELAPFIRPVVRVIITRKQFAIFLVHLISGVPVLAQREMDALIKSISSIIPQGFSALIVGDMNINLLTTAVNVPAKWRILNLGYSTQKSGGELDYGILYDANKQYGGATVTALANVQPNPPSISQPPINPPPLSPSDHAVLRYYIP